MSRELDCDLVTFSQKLVTLCAVLVSKLDCDNVVVLLSSQLKASRSTHAVPAVTPSAAFQGSAEVAAMEQATQFAREKTKVAFELLDLDEDGSLTRDEFTRFIGACRFL